MEELQPKRNFDTHEGALLGPCLASYAGYALDQDLRYDAASGGIVTALLLNAMENGDIDSALIVGSSEKDPFQACAIVTQSKQRILDAKGSKYLPVEFSAALRQIVRDGALKRVGIVGLPCHIEGIKRASSAIPILRNKIAFTIGLFCKQTKTLLFTDLILAKMGVKRNQVQDFRFRGAGWPGYCQATLKNGNTVRYPFVDFSPLWGVFSCTPAHCLMCSSPLADFADVSVGDAWHDQLGSENIGRSCFFVRTEIGLGTVDQAVQAGRIHVESVKASEIIDAQSRFVVGAKKLNPRLRLRVLSIFDTRILDLHVKNAFHGYIGGYLSVLWVFAIRCFFSSALFRRFFPLLPTFVLRMLSIGTIGVWKILFRLGG